MDNLYIADCAQRVTISKRKKHIRPYSVFRVVHFEPLRPLDRRAGCQLLINHLTRMKRAKSVPPLTRYWSEDDSLHEFDADSYIDRMDYR